MLVANETIDEHLTLPTVGVKVLPHLDDRRLRGGLTFTAKVFPFARHRLSIMQLGTEVKTRLSLSCLLLPPGVQSPLVGVDLRPT